ncbi:MAG: RNA recognition motif domain-containing protein [Candidatus Dojkabacteria bacterium]
MENKLFVGNLPWSTTDQSLLEIFSEVGEVTEAKVIVDKFKNRSKGFGFVTMATEELAQAAIDQLNGKEVDGRAINVSIARPPREHNDREGRKDDFYR